MNYQQNELEVSSNIFNTGLLLVIEAYLQYGTAATEFRVLRHHERPWI